MTTKQVIRSVLAHIRAKLARTPYIAELFCSLTVMAWAVIIRVSPFQMGDWPSMAMLLEIWSEPTWVLAAFGMGMVQLVCLLLDRRWPRWIMAILMGWFWALVTLAIWAATPWNPLAVMSAGWMGMSLFSVFRLLRKGG